MTTNTTDTTTHSPTPWRLDSSIGIIYDPPGNMALQYLEEPEHPITEANATHIVHCVNLHDELIIMLEAAVVRVEMENEDGNRILSAWAEDARFLLAKAKGGAR